MAWLSDSQLRDMGFLSLGVNVKISERASIYNCRNISIGNNVRIDDYCILSAGQRGIEIGSFVHIAAYSSLIGAEKITLSDFSGLSSRVSVYSSSDNYSGDALTNPTVPMEFRSVHNAEVWLGRHVIIGAGAVILPGVKIEDGAAIGALSLIKKDCQEFSMYMGVPAKKIGERRRDLLEVETRFKDTLR